MTNASLVTHDELKRILNYDPESGIFRWKVDVGNGVKKGDVTGDKKSTGYFRIGLKSKIYQAHRLAWFYVYGIWPEKQIDHINGDRSDNRIVNLRQATNSENNCNKTKYSNNVSGYKGVSWHKQAGKWCAEIWKNYKKEYLGLFNSPEEAYEAYCKAAEELHGEFANV